MIYQTVFLFISFLSLLFTFPCNGQNILENNNSPTIKNITFYADSLSSIQIEVENRSVEPSSFSMKLNNGFYLSEKEMVEEIKNMEPEFPGEQLERKAWRYVMKYIKYYFSFGTGNWQHLPVLMVNSLGTGECGELALGLNLIWKTLGFQSRVWGLGGHVVPEVFANNKWQMYDPSFQIYYLNYKNEVAGVEELSKNPELITKPINKTVNKIRDLSFMAGDGFTTETANVYSTDTNNQINNWYDYNFELKNEKFSMPGGAKMRFPLSFAEVKKLKSRRMPEYSFLSLEIPGSKKTEVEIPLVLYAIEGEGKVMVDSIEFQINSKELKNYLADFSQFHYHLVFSENPYPVKIYYFISRRSLSVMGKNLISFEGYETDSLQVNISTQKNAQKH